LDLSPRGLFDADFGFKKIIKFEQQIHENMSEYVFPLLSDIFVILKFSVETNGCLLEEGLVSYSRWSWSLVIGCNLLCK